MQAGHLQVWPEATVPLTSGIPHMGVVNLPTLNLLRNPFATTSNADRHARLECAFYLACLDIRAQRFNFPESQWNDGLRRIIH